MKVKLIAMDLDGTLNTDDKRITPRTKQALMRAQEAGIRLALASARPAPGLNKNSLELRLPEYDGVLMACNGGRICMAKDGRTLCEITMPLEVARLALTHLESFPVHPILDDGEKFYTSDANAFMMQYEAMNNNMPLFEVGRLRDFISFAPVKILMSCDPIILPSLIEDIRAPFADQLDAMMTAPFYLEMVPKGINKGRGLTDVCHALNISPMECISFGDAQNDIPLLQAAGLGVAMGNGAEETKAAADRITDTNNNDGIAIILEELEQKGWMI